ncbi:hypothetical protein K458DRAFT_485955 [Lentithecium fluviatile CBS 122367]|uniref:Uncharacterized protein n=1 Tax=Lentithecium fluviatile CBS 122367 TaxID=1168545 RepID=A0A6G1J8E9_9PLEO|nr:hypothetical protein K458DRAFT_485955 [Lentithecium fluviatile CBS 122367]
MQTNKDRGRRSLYAIQTSSGLYSINNFSLLPKMTDISKGTVDKPGFDFNTDDLSDDTDHMPEVVLDKNDSDKNDNSSHVRKAAVFKHPSRAEFDEGRHRWSEVRDLRLPQDGVPPTDFHTATYVPALDGILIVGNLSADNALAERGATPVHLLKVGSWKMEKVETNGEGPGVNYEHRAQLKDGVLKVGRLEEVEGREWE